MIARVRSIVASLERKLVRLSKAHDWRERLVIAWSGMRGAISLAAALAVTATVTERPQIIFVTVVVILVTLVGQGLTLPAVIRVLGISDVIQRLRASRITTNQMKRGPSARRPGGFCGGMPRPSGAGCTLHPFGCSWSGRAVLGLDGRCVRASRSSRAGG